MRAVLILLALLTLPFLALPLPALAGLREVQLADGRWYLFDRPAGTAPVPLILALHGGGGNPRQFARDSGLATRAVAAGFAIAFPAGTGGRAGRLLSWNAGYCCARAQAEGVDDAGFLDRVAADAGRRFGAGGPLFLTGMSNGAMMAQTYAALRGARVAGVASVSGTMDAARLAPAAAVPLLHIHGTADRMVPFAGGVGQSSLTRTDFAAAATVLQAFRAPFGAMTEVTATRSAGGFTFTQTEWRKGGRARVVLIAIGGGRHEWPGGRRAEDQALQASDEIIAFFAAQLR